MQVVSVCFVTEKHFKLQQVVRKRKEVNKHLLLAWRGAAIPLRNNVANFILKIHYSAQEVLQAYQYATHMKHVALWLINRS